jgi:hypothetical protein
MKGVDPVGIPSIVILAPVGELEMLTGCLEPLIMVAQEENKLLRIIRPKTNRRYVLFIVENGSEAVK